MSPLTLEAPPANQATQALRQSPIYLLRKIAIEETEATVILRGTVPSYYMKQLAQETVLPVLDGRALVNQVAVVPPLGD